jgi:hypothetical protein
MPLLDGEECLAMRLCGFLESIMLELRHRALLKNKFGKKKRKQDMILEEKNL